MTRVRLNKFLSQGGVSSRRKADELIKEGKIKVNNILAKLGNTIDPDQDRIEVNGKLIKPKANTYIALYKPKGYTTTLKDKYAEKIVSQLLPEGLNLFPVGRLDKDAEGLLLFTNDGDFAFRVSHPRFGVSKEYEVVLNRTPTKTEIQKMLKGLKSDGEIIKADNILRVNKVIYKVVMKEGKKREVKRLFMESGIKVLGLKRVKIGNLGIGDLGIGKFIYIRAEDVI